VGIVSAELSNPFYPALIEPVHDELAKHAFRTILVTDRGQEPVEIEPLIDGSLDGVILTTTELDSSLPGELKARGLPLVLLNRDTHEPEYDVCVVDNEAGVRELARLLAELGHVRIAAIFGPTSTSTGVERRDGFAAALAELGIPLEPELVYCGPFSPETGYQGFGKLWRQRPTAIFCGNDVIALGARNAAAAQGVIVPGDVTLVGFDNIPMSGWNLFDLTTVGVAIEELARRAVQLLIARMNDPKAPPERVRMKPRLHLRSTHAKPRSSNRSHM